MNTMVYFKKPTIITVAVVIALFILVSLFGNTPWSLNKSYHNKSLDLSFDYPNNYELSERPEQKGVAIVDLFAKDKSHILLVFLAKTKSDADNDRKFYESILFTNPDQRINSHITVGDFEGFRAVTDPYQLRHTIYKDTNASSSLIVRSELNASSSESIISSEDVFLKIIRSIKFK